MTGLTGSSTALAPLPLRWRHEHRFEPVGTARTRVVDNVDTQVPARVLRATFAYRHRQLAADLSAAQLGTAAQTPLL